MYMKQSQENALVNITKLVVTQRTVRGVQVMRKEVRNNGKRASM